MLPLKEGQQVVIKNPGPLMGIVVRARSGDKGLPEEQKLYLVQIPPKRYRRSALEPVQQSSETLGRGSREWLAEMRGLIESGQRWLANQNDSAARDQFVESGRKLGIFIPIN
jgi:hypothetical protein